MFTLISDQTAWYLKQSDKLRAVSKNINMEHPKGRDKELRLVHKKLTHLLDIMYITNTFKKEFGHDSTKIETGIKEISDHLILIEKEIIKNNYQDSTFVNGAVEWNSLVEKAREHIVLKN